MDFKPFNAFVFCLNFFHLTICPWFSFEILLSFNRKPIPTMYSCIGNCHALPEAFDNSKHRFYFNIISKIFFSRESTIWWIIEVEIDSSFRSFLIHSICSHKFFRSKILDSVIYAIQKRLKLVSRRANDVRRDPNERLKRSRRTIKYRIKSFSHPGTKQ